MITFKQFLQEQPLQLKMHYGGKKMKFEDHEEFEQEIADNWPNLKKVSEDGCTYHLNKKDQVVARWDEKTNRGYVYQNQALETT